MKSKFQKPDATYPHGSLREQPEMKKPVMEFELSDDEGIRQQAKDWQIYNEQLKKCRVIPCSENNLKDGQELEEGKDYELHFVKMNDKHEDVFVAIPIVAQETEDDLWEQVQDIARYEFDEKNLRELKRKFTINLKQ